MKMPIVGGAFRLPMSCRRFPGRGQVVEAVPMDARCSSSQELCGPPNAPVLHFIGAERGYANLGHPDREGNDFLDFGKLFRPLIDFPEIPVERKAMDGYRIDMREHAV